MTTLLLLLIIPIAWPIIAKLVWKNQICIKEMGVQLFATILVTVVIYQVGTYSQTSDHEIWNGKINKKERIHDDYEESYDCNCSTDKDGNESCDTCYETHYTVTWNLQSTIGTIQVDHKDSTWQSVYDTPNPTIYDRAFVGESCSRTMRYTNYVQAVPRSLFHKNEQLTQQFAGKIPAYPKVHGLYHFDRVINVGTKVKPDVIKKFDEDLDIILQTLGPVKQANIIIILTNIQDPMYRFAVENAWQGGEKNDIVIFLGLEDNNYGIAWVDIMTWALNKGNEMFHVTMRDGIKDDIGVLEIDKLVPYINQTVLKLYDRPQMADFEHLEKDIDPPGWTIIIAMIAQLLLSIGLTYYFYRNRTF